MDFVEGRITFPKDDPPRMTREEYENVMSDLRTEISDLQDQLRRMFKLSSEELYAYVSETKQIKEKIIILDFTVSNITNLEELIRYFIDDLMFYQFYDKESRRALMTGAARFENVYEMFLYIREELKRMIIKWKELQREKEKSC